MAGTDNNWEVDPNSYANVNNFKVNHMKLNLKTEFERKALTGYVINEVEIVDNSVNKFILDTRGLKVFSSSWVKNDGSEISLDVSSILLCKKEIIKLYSIYFNVDFKIII